MNSRLYTHEFFPNFSIQLQHIVNTYGLGVDIIAPV